MPIAGANPLALIAELQNGAELANYFTKSEVTGLLESMDSVEVGKVVYFAADAPKPGFLRLNGAEVLRDDFPRLYGFAVNSGNLFDEGVKDVGQFGTGDGNTTFTLPLVAGVAIRSLDDGAGLDVGRIVGTYQEDEVKAHKHTIPAYSYANTGGSGNSGRLGRANDSGGSSYTFNKMSSVGGIETRMKNIAYIACIKY